MRRWAAESAGTTVLVVVLCGALSSGSALAPVAMGAATAILLALGPRADGSYNPAVAAAQWIRGGMTGRNLAGVVAAQAVGAVAAAVAGRALLGVAGTSPDASGAVGGLADQAMPALAPALVAMEAAGTFCLVLVACRLRSDATSPAQSAVVLGLTVMTMSVAAGQFGAGLFNPAAGIAAAAVGLLPPSVATACAAAQLLGAVAAAVVLGVGRGRAVRVPDAPARSGRVVGVVSVAPGDRLPSVPRPRSAGDHASAGHTVVGHGSMATVGPAGT